MFCSRICEHLQSGTINLDYIRALHCQCPSLNPPLCPHCTEKIHDRFLLTAGVDMIAILSSNTISKAESSISQCPSMRGDELICQHSGVDHILCTGNSARCLACLYKQNGSVCLAPNCTPGLAPCLACRKCWINIY